MQTVRSFLGGSADVGAMMCQHVELSPDRAAAVGDVEEVAGVAVLRDQSQGAALAGAADQHRRPWRGSSAVGCRMFQLQILTAV